MVASGCAAVEAAEDEHVVLKFADSFSTTHPIGKGGVEPFLNYVKEHGPKAGLEIEHFPGGSLGKQKDMGNLLRTNSVQIAAVIPAYLGSQIPMSSVGELPGLVEDTCIGIDALMPLMSDGGILYEEEMEPMGIRPIWGVMLSGYEIMTSEKRVVSPDDLRGELIRSTGGVGDRVVANLGAAGVSLAVPDLYEAVSRKTVSGALLPTLSVLSYSLEEVLGYTTKGANLGTSTITYAVSEQAWVGLNDEQRAVIKEASAIAQRGACAATTENTAAAMEKIEASGVEVSEISEETAPDWESALLSVQEDWVRDLETIGKPAGDVLKAFKTSSEMVSK
jgi:TRAP-type C4-dicarboxylate transport system substrate-binding protein